jgi:molybdopterin-guanine dinucleotide biosynthesis protein B
MYEKMNRTPLITVIGKSGSGKTTLLVKLIAEFKGRGYKVATIKHHSHSGFDIDKPGKDSWRHAQAGSDHVVVAAPDKIASYRLLERELSLDEISAEIQGVDIILVEGYRSAGKPSIEIVRAETGLELIGKPEKLIAVAVDTQLDINIPQFNLNDSVEIVDYLEIVLDIHFK